MLASVRMQHSMDLMACDITFPLVVVAQAFVSIVEFADDNSVHAPAG